MLWIYCSRGFLGLNAEKLGERRRLGRKTMDYPDPGRGRTVLEQLLLLRNDLRGLTIDWNGSHLGRPGASVSGDLFAVLISSP